MGRCRQRGHGVAGPWNEMRTMPVEQSPLVGAAGCALSLSKGLPSGPRGRKGRARSSRLTRLDAGLSSAPGHSDKSHPRGCFFIVTFRPRCRFACAAGVSPLGFSGFLWDERLFVPVTSLSSLRHRGVNCDGIISDVLITSLVHLERGSGCFGRGTRSPWLRGASSLHGVLLRALPSEDSPRRHFSFK